MDNGILIIILIFVVLTFILLFACSFLIITIAKENWKKIKNSIATKNPKKSAMTVQEKSLFIKLMLECLLYLSQKKIGALIVIEKNNSLSLYEETGFKLDANFSPEFLIAIFSNKSVSFHDGALIISDGKIRSISCYLPISKNTIDLKYGARHRAALGISEVTDAIAIVVSETNGNISYAKKGELINLRQDKKTVEEMINKVV